MKTTKSYRNSRCLLLLAAALPLAMVVGAGCGNNSKTTSEPGSNANPQGNSTIPTPQGVGGTNADSPTSVAVSTLPGLSTNPVLGGPVNTGTKPHGATIPFIKTTGVATNPIIR